MSDCFKSLFMLICNVVVLSYYVCSVIVLCSLFLSTVIIRVKEFY